MTLHKKLQARDEFVYFLHKKVQTVESKSSKNRAGRFSKEPPIETMMLLSARTPDDLTLI